MLKGLYQGKRCLLTGGSGFLGRAIEKKLLELGANVTYLANGEKRLDFFFHFGSPSSQVLFNRKPGECISYTIKSFRKALEFSASVGAKLVYPSTGLISSKSPLNAYAMTKKLTEEIAKREAPNSLGIRLFATYGPGEGHKLDYASVPYLFTRAARFGKTITIFGDGSQTRDFIYIDDAVEAILFLAALETGVVELGSGEEHSFNEIVEILSQQYEFLDLEYVDKPFAYVDHTKADTSVVGRYFNRETVSLEEGIAEIIKELL